MIKPFCPICNTDVDNAVCMECGYNQAAAAPQEIEIEPQEAKKLLAAGAVLIDVRRPDELEIAKISGSIHMQLDTLPQNFSNLDKSREEKLKSILFMLFFTLENSIFNDSV